MGNSFNMELALDPLFLYWVCLINLWFFQKKKSFIIFLLLLLGKTYYWGG